MGTVAHVRASSLQGLANTARVVPNLLECMRKGGEPVPSASSWHASWLLQPSLAAAPEFCGAN